MRVEVPDHVVCREFSAETVALNLQNGRYYGLNPTAARMLDALRDTGETGAALERLRGEFPEAQERLNADLDRLCRDLESAGVLIVTAP